MQQPQWKQKHHVEILIKHWIYSCTGFLCNERKRLLNRDNHPCFDTTNCIQGTRYLRDVTNPSATFGAIFTQSWSLLLWQKSRARADGSLMHLRWHARARLAHACARASYSTPYLLWRLYGGTPAELAHCSTRILISSPCEQHELQTQSAPLSPHCGAAS